MHVRSWVHVRSLANKRMHRLLDKLNVVVALCGFDSDDYLFPPALSLCSVINRGITYSIKVILLDANEANERCKSLIRPSSGLWDDDGPARIVRVEVEKNWR